jgi:hypothetical protein
MPDIDTLFIIGLVIASFIGNIAKKKAKENEPKREVEGKGSPPSEDLTIEDALREAWKTIKQPPSDQGELSPPPLVIKPEPVEEKKIPRIETSKQKEIRDLYIEESSDAKDETEFDFKMKHFLRSKRSLKHAFLLKEILDEPISIRKSSYQ